MQSSRILRTAALAATRVGAARKAASVPCQIRAIPRRRFAADAAPSPNSQPNISRPAKPTEAKPIEIPAPKEGKKVAGPTAEPATAAEAASTGGAAQAPAGTTSVAARAQADANIPDIHSTSLGMEDPASNDPLKWKKFAWKYAGAVILFMVSYKTLHWYVERLEADGKRRRAEVEENKEIIREIDTPREAKHLASSSAVPVAAPAAAVGDTSTGPVGAEQVGQVAQAGLAMTAQEEPVPQMRIFDQVKEEEPNMVSEVEELYVYRVELEAKLRDLREGKKTKEGDAKQRQIKIELKELEDEIRMLEAAEANKAKS